ncbi:uncharacterized protein LOC119668685 [Teleopsis dalmanni]|uniref:uncharacterized protein LOC119668685 n=1 Tax=Teleopsis dalmanni TaxID=139649 RepID=UPI000D32A372|nr:uncharacterized protein LOC119668685 [Teleopsis dalmanni]
MRHLLILCALIAFALAAPALDKDDGKSQGIGLQRPSPINPHIAGESKPADKITKITDPKEIAKYQPESKIKNSVAPQKTILVTTNAPKHRQKRDEPLKETIKTLEKIETAAEDARLQLESTISETEKVPAKLPIDVVAHDVTTERPYPDVKREIKEKPVAEPSSPQEQITFAKPQTLPAILAVDPIYQINTEQLHTLVKRETPLKPEAESTNQEEITLVKPQILPAILPADDPAHHLNLHNSHTGVKRDIPVPLVAKHAHPEDSAVDNKAAESQKEEKLSTEVVKPQIGDVQVEDLSDKVPAQLPQEHHLQQQHEHIHHKSHEFHPEHVYTHPRKEVDDKKVETTSDSSTTSTTVHPIIRPHPVPVAELFARPKQ